MDVILSKDIEKVGKTGDVVQVKDGFGRNFLIPNKFAYLATPANLKKIEQEKIKRLIQEEAKKKEAEELAQKLAKLSLTISVEVNDLEKLYGSITELDVAKALSAEGYDIDKKAIILEKPIEALGIYEVGIKLHTQVSAKIRLWITKK